MENARQDDVWDGSGDSGPEDRDVAGGAVKALSLSQPWAWMVVHGGKTIENRRWNTKFRGEFLIHAAKGATKAQYESALDFAYGVRAPGLRRFLISENELGEHPRIPELSALERGGVVGVARLVDVLAPPEEEQGWEHDWRMVGQFGFVLEDIRPLLFLPCSGALGFWGDFEIRDGAAVRL